MRSGNRKLMIHRHRSYLLVGFKIVVKGLLVVLHLGYPELKVRTLRVLYEGPLFLQDILVLLEFKAVLLDVDAHDILVLHRLHALDVIL
jgi:hypothetical protein